MHPNFFPFHFVVGSGEVDDELRAIYEGSILINGDKESDALAATKGLKQGCPLSPLLYLLYTNDLGRFLNTPECRVLTSLEATKVSHTDIALVATTAQHLQFQLDRFYDCTLIKGLTKYRQAQSYGLHRFQ